MKIKKEVFNIVPRTNTKVVMVANLQIGGQNHVVMQSMCNIKTSHVDEVVQQILALEHLGVEMMRVSIMDEEDAKAVKEIKRKIHVPLVGDIHFDYRLALLAIENGIDKIRINPGNIGDVDKVRQVVEACKEKNIPIRIGVNSGSLDSTFQNDNPRVSAEQLVASCQKHVRMIEEMGYDNLVLSLKGSNVLETMEAYRLASQIFPYPLHIGITEAGTRDLGIVRSVAGLSPLLVDGIGDTMRISLSCDPSEEVIAMKRLLHDLGLYPNYPTLIACPTCGRTQVNVQEIAKKVEEKLEEIHQPITIAVMGCIVNGPGEAKHADIGIAGGKDTWLLFRKGEIVRKVKSTEILSVLFEEIQSFLS